VARCGRGSRRRPPAGPLPPGPPDCSSADWTPTCTSVTHQLIRDLKDDSDPAGRRCLYRLSPARESQICIKCASLSELSEGVHQLWNQTSRTFICTLGKQGAISKFDLRHVWIWADAREEGEGGGGVIILHHISMHLRTICIAQNLFFSCDTLHTGYRTGPTPSLNYFDFCCGQGQFSFLSARRVFVVSARQKLATACG